jgi:hypothetical protein
MKRKLDGSTEMFVMSWMCKKGTVKALWLLSDQGYSIRKHKRAILALLALSTYRSKQFFVNRVEAHQVIATVGSRLLLVLTMKAFLFKLQKKSQNFDNTLVVQRSPYKGNLICFLFFKITVFKRLPIPISWLYSLLDLRRFFSFLILNTVGRTPWTGDQPIARQLPTHRKTQIQNKLTQTSMP